MLVIVCLESFLIFVLTWSVFRLWKRSEKLKNSVIRLDRKLRRQNIYVCSKFFHRN